MGKPQIVGEKKRELKEQEPPKNLIFVHIAGSYDLQAMKKFLVQFIKNE